MKVESGVPQGSVLGPLLFLIGVNDLPYSILNTFTVMFADDTSFFNAHSDYNELKLISQQAVNEASLWFSANGLVLNQDKTQVLICMPRNKQLDVELEQHDVKILGLVLDKSLSWHPQVESVCNKLARVIYLLSNLVKLVPETYILSAYHAFFHSILSYGLILWGNSCHVKSVLLLQKKAIRIVTKSSFYEHCRPLFVRTKVMTVINMYIFLCLLHVKKNHRNLPLRKDVHSYNTRKQSSIDMPYSRLSACTRSYHILSLKLFNLLHVDTQSLPYKHFRIRIHDWLILNPFYNISEFFESGAI